MKVLFLGFIKLKFDTSNYNSFENYIDFKEKVDYVFQMNSVALEKIPEKPTPDDSYAFYNFSLEYESEKYFDFMNIMEELKLKDKINFRLEIKFTKKEMEQAPLLSMATYFNFYSTNIKKDGDC